MSKHLFVTQSFIMEHPVIFLEIVGVVTLGAIVIAKMFKDKFEDGNVLVIGFKNKEED